VEVEVARVEAVVGAGSGGSHGDGAAAMEDGDKDRWRMEEPLPPWRREPPPSIRRRELPPLSRK
jgi:hypothetical protein